MARPADEIKLDLGSTVRDDPRASDTTRSPSTDEAELVACLARIDDTLSGMRRRELELAAENPPTTCARTRLYLVASGVRAVAHGRTDVRRWPC